MQISPGVNDINEIGSGVQTLIRDLFFDLAIYWHSSTVNFTSFSSRCNAHTHTHTHTQRNMYIIY